MAEYDAHYAEAERLRVNGNTPNDYRRAIYHYRRYIGLGGPRVVDAEHMMGECYYLLHEYEEAFGCYVKALEGAWDYERGNIKRDVAESYQALSRDDLAERSLATSLDLLPYHLYPSEHAASLGFLARLRLSQGLVDEAVETFADADLKLHVSGNRHMELYNKLHYASALFRHGQHGKARRTALACLKLSLSKDRRTGRRYGSRRHHKRALVLLVGGYRLEEFLKAIEEQVTEEELAARLGLKQTWRMKRARRKVLRRAPHTSAWGDFFGEALGRYQQLGQRVVDRKSDEGDARAKAQIGLTLLTAGIRREVAAYNSQYEALWRQDLDDAYEYAWNMRLDSEITDAIQQLINGGIAPPR